MRRRCDAAPQRRRGSAEALRRVGVCASDQLQQRAQRQLRTAMFSRHGSTNISFAKSAPLASSLEPATSPASSCGLERVSRTPSAPHAGGSARLPWLQVLAQRLLDLLDGGGRASRRHCSSGRCAARLTPARRYVLPAGPGGGAAACDDVMRAAPGRVATKGTICQTACRPVLLSGPWHSRTAARRRRFRRRASAGRTRGRHRSASARAAAMLLRTSLASPWTTARATSRRVAPGAAPTALQRVRSAVIGRGRLVWRQTLGRMAVLRCRTLRCVCAPSDALGVR